MKMDDGGALPFRRGDTAMTPSSLFRRLPLSALAALGAAGLGASLGGMPELARAADPVPLASLALMAGVAGWMWWRNQGPRSRFATLGIRLDPAPAHPAAPGAVLRFVQATPRLWQAWQGSWCLELAEGQGGEPGWSLALRPGGAAAKHAPLAHAATLDALLALLRHMAGRGLHLPPEAQAAAALLEGDFEFLLPASRQRIMALAEGGYALYQPTGCKAISAQAARAMLAQGSPVPTAGR
ncbi:hypothetical protein CR162_17100 [Pseudoroseomonas rhizosphaerae]|uniref:Uncharacterized protein n=2 Tax=Teichococcus rhizosphaerae TaxID=1335062 RepID=A0A2C7A8M1_9PROT|nr:hypothetical protein CR162_17100 [Pseudoroseomonas rhizosphaerae]